MSGDIGGLPMASLVRHRRIIAAGVETFYREAGRHDAPVLLLPHGYHLLVL